MLFRSVYVLFGWLAVLALKPMLETVHPVALGLLVLGGLIYTAGVFVFISPRVRYRRAIWHGFVVAGAGVHWVAVLLGVVLARVWPRPRLLLRSAAQGDVAESGDRIPPSGM